jgi:hypothetical protein
MLSMSDIELYKPWSGGGAVAHGHLQRRKGLSGLERESITEPMIFDRCRSIHTFGMKFSLIVVCVDVDFVVLSTRVVPPRRVVWAPKGTRAIIELPFD